MVNQNGESGQLAASPVQPVETAVAKAIPQSQSGTLLAQAVNNAQEVFGFKEQWVELHEDGAYCVKGKVAPFGPGALHLGRLAGVYIHTPDDLMFEDGQRHKNPHIVRNPDGVIVEANYRKIAIHMEPNGHIKYKDFIFSRSITIDIARRAMALMRNADVPKNAKRFATRQMVEDWNKKSSESGEPGAPIWLYFEIPNNPAGIAINTNDPHASVLDFIESNIELENFFKSSTETKAERRAIYYMIPHSFSPVQTPENYKPRVVKRGNTDVVESAWFVVNGPTKAGVLLVLLQKLLIAMLGEDDENILRAKEAFAGALNINPETIVVTPVEGEPAGVPDPDKLEDAQWSPGGTDKPVEPAKKNPGIDPVPAKAKTAEFQEYVKAQIPKLTDEEYRAFAEKVSLLAPPECLDPNGELDRSKIYLAVTKDTAPKFATAFKRIIEAREKAATPQPAITATQARAFINGCLEEERMVERINLTLANNGFSDDTSIEDVPDAIILAVYQAISQPMEPKLGNGAGSSLFGK